MAKTCTRCGSALVDEAVFCRNCGQKTSSGRSLFAGLIAAVVALAIIISIITGIVFAAIHIAHSSSGFSSNTSSVPAPRVPNMPFPKGLMNRSFVPTTLPVLAPLDKGKIFALIGAPAPAITLIDWKDQEPGSLFTIHGEHLDNTSRVFLISLRDNQIVDAKIELNQSDQISARVPELNHPERGAVLGLQTSGGLAITFPQDCLQIYSGRRARTAGHYELREGGLLEGVSYAIVVAEHESLVNLGDHCIAFLHANSAIAGHGKQCVIFAEPGAELTDPAAKDVITVPSIKVNYFLADLRYEGFPASTYAKPANE